MTRTARIALTNTKVPALVDAADLRAVLAAGPWHARFSGRTAYAACRNNGRVRTLHALLTGWSYVDHINGDGLDNRRSNLRKSSHQQNLANQRISKNNTSGFKGVSRHGAGWRAAITVHGVRSNLGTFPSKEDAARAYDEAATEAFGEFARTNFGATEGRQIVADDIRRADRTRCKNGHEWTEENTHFDGRRRICRACVRERSRRYRLNRKEIQR